MKTPIKSILIILLITFFSLFLFTLKKINLKSKSLSLNSNYYEQHTYKITIPNLKNIDLVKTYKDYDFKYITITPSIQNYLNIKYTLNSNNIEEISSSLTTNYINKLKEIGKEEEAIYFYNKGFNIDSIYVTSMNKDILKLLDTINNIKIKKIK